MLIQPREIILRHQTRDREHTFILYCFQLKLTGWVYEIPFLTNHKTWQKCTAINLKNLQKKISTPLWVERLRAQTLCLLQTSLEPLNDGCQPSRSVTHQAQPAIIWLTADRNLTIWLQPTAAVVCGLVGPIGRLLCLFCAAAHPSVASRNLLQYHLVWNGTMPHVIDILTLGQCAAICFVLKVDMKQ